MAGGRGSRRCRADPQRRARRTPPGRAPPTRRPGDREDHLAGVRRHPGGERQGGERQVDVGVRWPLAAASAVDRGDGGAPRRAHRRAGRAASPRGGPRRGRAGGRSRAAAARPAGARPRPAAARRPGTSCSIVVRQRAGRCRAAALHRRQPGRDHGVGVRPHRRGGAYGDRRGGQVVVDEHDERGVQAAQHVRVRSPAGEPRPQPGGQRSRPAPRGARPAVRRAGPDQRGEQPACGAEHRGAPSVEAQRVRRPRRRRPRPAAATRGPPTPAARPPRRRAAASGSGGRDEAGRRASLAGPQPLRRPPRGRGAGRGRRRRHRGRSSRSSLDQGDVRSGRRARATRTAAADARRAPAAPVQQRVHLGRGRRCCRVPSAPDGWSGRPRLT